MKKTLESLIISVIETTGNKALLLEKIEFSSGKIIFDVCQCSSLLSKSLYITVDEAGDILVYNDKGDLERIVSSSYKTQVEKAVSLTLALCQLGF